MTTEKISGSTSLRTHNGEVTCREISGNTQLKSHNGGIKTFYSDTAPSICDISIITYNGGIELETPPDYSARIDASTHNGSVHTDLPITVTGKVSKNKLTGTIGTGEGNLNLETHNGSIKIR